MPQSSNYDLAVRLATAGLAVFPLRRNDRHPLVAWRRESTTDTAVVTKWWQQYPQALPGLDLTRCGLVVLDGDRHDPRVDGVAALRQLLSQPPTADLTAVPMTRTPRDGVHVYFRQPSAALTNRRGSLPAGIDIRGAGGFVVAPGAELPDGRRYEPIKGRPDLALAFTAKTIPEVPAAIVALVDPPRRRTKTKTQRHGPVRPRERAYAKAALRRSADELAATPPGGRNQALNKAAFVLGTMAARGWISRDEVEDALRAAMARNGYEADKGTKAIEATLASGLNAGVASPHDDLPEEGVTLDDFVAYMPAHYYLFLPCREPWPAASVDAKLGKVTVTDGSGVSKEIRASTWLDIHRSAEQMTWAPGEPPFVYDRLVVLGGWIKRDGVRTLNLYRPPTIQLGNAADADPWLDHVHTVYPQDADHIIRWLAHRVQRPGEKINHLLVLGGLEGIGKDTLLEPAKHAVGPWNFHEISPHNLLGRFNAYLKSVILRISEARDSGELDRFALHDRLKVYAATPPDVLRVDEKHLREYYIFNCCGVIITTNYRTDALYLPATDRRHYVAWSALTKEDFASDYWPKLWGWYQSGGLEHVAAYLAEFDISGFDPKAPPPKTPAFRSIVDAGNQPEDAELADALDALGRLDKVTLAEIRQAADSEFDEWLGDRRNRRVIPHRMERCGYVRLRNDSVDDGLWIVKGKRQVVYIPGHALCHRPQPHYQGASGILRANPSVVVSDPQQLPNQCSR
jgi:hypothetical protein